MWVHVLFILLLSSSCESLEIRQMNSGDSIEIGNYTNMSVISYDSLFYGSYNELKYLDLDLNEDEIFDYRFTSEIWGSPGMGMHPRVQMLSLHPDCQMNGFLARDTVFFHSSYDTIYSENFYPVNINIYTTYSCKRVDSADSILSISQDNFKINYLDAGDHLWKSELFKADTIIKNDNSPILDPIEYVEGLIIRRFNYYNNFCYSFPEEEIKYLGFMLADGDKEEKLGWIKCSILSNSKVLIFETAIQE